jgi:hypothetical protein
VGIDSYSLLLFLSSPQTVIQNNLHNLLFKTKETITTTLDRVVVFTVNNNNSNNNDKLPEKQQEEKTNISKILT